MLRACDRRARRGAPDGAALDRLRRERELADLLDGSLANGDFSVLLQPKVRLADGAVAGAEALARWFHPREGTIYPSEFVPVLERSGAVRALDLYVFERVCERLARWLREGREPVPVSVNLSRRHFEDPRFVARFADTADRLGVPRGLLEMELTESIFLDDEAIDNEKRAVRDLRAAGFSCSLDDFGSDYSSLGLLKEFDVSALELDRRFFREDTPRTRDVVEAVVPAAKLGLDTVAEGIEDERQLAFLQSVGCGPCRAMFAEPLPFDEFERGHARKGGRVGRARPARCPHAGASRNARTAASRAGSTCPWPGRSRSASRSAAPEPPAPSAQHVMRCPRGRRTTSQQAVQPPACRAVIDGNSPGSPP